MGYTRKQFIDGALEELGLAPYTFDIQPEQYEGAMRRLDAMMADWNGKGIRLGYPIPSNPGGGELSDETAVPDSAWQAVTANLALRIAVMFGKQPIAMTVTAASSSLGNLLRAATQPGERAANMQVSGSGNKPWRWRGSFIPATEEPLLAGADGPLEFE